MSTSSDIPKIWADKLIDRLQVTIIIAAIIIVASLLLSAFMPFDLYQKIAIIMSAIVIAAALVAVLWVQWTKTIFKQERVLKS